VSAGPAGGPRFVLIHSPVVGPRTWAPVARRLTELGHAVTVPSLLAVGDADPPFWPHVVVAVTAALCAGSGRAAIPDPGERGAPVVAAGAGLGTGQPVVLAVHSNAGVFLPVIRRALAPPVLCSVFADATVPAAGGTTATAGEDFLPFLRGLAGPDGRLPRWTEWWPDEDLSSLFPDPQTRDSVVAELPRLPLAYYTEQVPAPAGWDDHPCAFLHFSAGYDGEAETAAQRGWPVRRLPGEHLHQLVDPAGVAAALLEFAASAAGRSWVSAT
jgi:hypothetical protein